MNRRSRRAAAIVALGAILGLVMGLVVISDGSDSERTARVVGPDLHPDVVVTRWSDLELSADRRTLSVLAADPVVGACTRPLGVNLEIRDDLVVVRPAFELQPDAVCEQACDVIPLSIELDEALPADITFVASPAAVPTCDEGVPLDE